MAELKKKATRESYGEALAELGDKYDNLYVFDADLAAATKTGIFKKKFPDRFFDCGIAESNMMGVAAGMAATGKIPFASTFAMFAAGRAFEQVRNSIGYPHLNVKIGATHAGISVGEDGATHQCNEDIALMRTIPGMVVINPADDVEAKAAVEAAILHEGPVYLRFGRLATPVFNDPETYKFELGKGVKLRDGIPKDAKWVGLTNYSKIWTDVSFWNAFKNTAFFAVVSILLINVLAFFIAYALTQKMRGSNLFRTVFFMPNLIGGVVLGYIWSMIFDGILRNYATYLTANATYGFWGLVILVAWQQIGYMMIIYIAGLQAVSGDMLEAAEIDGASGSQTLFRVIIPNVMPSITTCTFLTLTNSFKLFDQNLALTGGLPSVIQNGAKFNQTELLALNIYSTYNINKNWHGVAQAKAVIFFILVAVLAIAQQAATRRKEVQQ